MLSRLLVKSLNRVHIDSSEETTLERDNYVLTLCIPSFNHLESTEGSFSNSLIYFSLL